MNLIFKKQLPRRTFLRGMGSVVALPLLDGGEFLRRFLLHVLPKGFHRIRHYGLLASAGRKANIARARELLAAPQPDDDSPNVDAARA